jgi:hypothetical protein
MVGPDNPPGIKIFDHSPAKPGVFQPMSNSPGALAVLTDTTKGERGWLGVKPDEWTWISPWGKPGRHLWIQETWTNRGIGGALKPRDMLLIERDSIIYRADWNSPPPYVEWRPSTQMPRWASRFTLEIEAVDAFQLKVGQHLLAATGMNNAEDFASWWDKKHGKKGIYFNYDLEGLPDDVVPYYAQRKFLPDGQLFKNHPWAWRLTVKQVNDGD